MALPPLAPDVLPSMEHNGVTITVLNHHGFSRPDRGPAPASRIIYGATDAANNERHWRSSLHEIEQLINRNFAASGI